MDNIVALFQARQTTHQALQLYALVDGYQYQHYFGTAIAYKPGVNRPLFVGTHDAPLADAGPWLVDVRHSELIDHLQTLESAMASVSWLFAFLSLEGLAQ